MRGVESSTFFLGSAKNSWMKNAIIHLPIQERTHTPQHYIEISTSIFIQHSFQPINSWSNSWILSVSMCDDCREITSSGVDRGHIHFSLSSFFHSNQVAFFHFISFRIVFVNLSSFLNDVLAFFPLVVRFIELYVCNAHSWQRESIGMRAYCIRETHTDTHFRMRARTEQKTPSFFLPEKKYSEFRAVLYTHYSYTNLQFICYILHVVLYTLFLPAMPMPNT